MRARQVLFSPQCGPSSPHPSTSPNTRRRAAGELDLKPRLGLSWPCLRLLLLLLHALVHAALLQAAMTCFTACVLAPSCRLPPSSPRALVLQRSIHPWRKRKHERARASPAIHCPSACLSTAVALGKGCAPMRADRAASERRPAQHICTADAALGPVSLPPGATCSPLTRAALLETSLVFPWCLFLPTPY